jgi:hypothetical protein
MAIEAGKVASDSKAAAAGSVTTRRCPECGTKYTKSRENDAKGNPVHCKPLSERQGPIVGGLQQGHQPTGLVHPGTEGTMANSQWRDYLESVSRITAKVMRNGAHIIFGPFKGA